jgi:hypothetical protein
MIKKLPPLLVSRIASGQIAVSPSSVIKELVENSLDAESSKVMVFINDQFNFRVVDNGRGIRLEEIPFSIERFTTDKIKKLEDFESLRTYGFRGEALNAIASVSRLTLKSQHHEEDVGGKLTVEAGEVVKLCISPENTFETSKTNNCGAAGTYIKIKHLVNGNELYSLYAHLFPTSILVSKGQKVRKGQVIAYGGNSGHSTGAHLHFAISDSPSFADADKPNSKPNNKNYRLNPLCYLPVDRNNPEISIAQRASSCKDNEVDGGLGLDYCP